MLKSIYKFILLIILSFSGGYYTHHKLNSVKLRDIEKLDNQGFVVLRRFWDGVGPAPCGCTYSVSRPSREWEYAFWGEKDPAVEYWCNYRHGTYNKKFDTCELPRDKFFNQIRDEDIKESNR
jgi:hypothetical protein